MSSPEPLYDASEMREAEAGYNGSTLELMERAGQEAARIVLERFPEAQRVAVVCGHGNNGGDGLVVARLLHQVGRQVKVGLVGDPEALHGAPAENYRRAREAGVPFTDAWTHSDVVVDALFGTGFAGAPREDARATIEAINAAGLPVVSVDAPSGVDASTGEVAGPAVRATVTVTFHGRKVGLVVAPGRFYAGEVEVVDIGLGHAPTRVGRLRAESLGAVPRRRAESTKFTAGTVLVVGGSAGLTGAPCLSAEAALRAGAGYVFAAFPASLALVFEVRLLEVVKRPLVDGGRGLLDARAAEEILELSSRAGAVALGPGLGRAPDTQELVRLLLERLEVPVVLDADGLFAVAGHLEWVRSRRAPTVLTPHAGELGRLLEREPQEVDAHRLAAAQDGADRSGAVLLLKGADTIVAAPDRGPLLSDLGNPGLATAGSGDVLTGVIAAFLAKGMEPQLAAACGATAQGMAAGIAARDIGYAGLVASDVARALSRALS